MTQPQDDVGEQAPHRLDVISKVINLRYMKKDSSLILAQDPLGVCVFDTKTVSVHHPSIPALELYIRLYVVLYCLQGALSKTRNLYNQRVSESL